MLTYRWPSFPSTSRVQAGEHLSCLVGRGSVAGGGTLWHHVRNGMQGWGRRGLNPVTSAGKTGGGGLELCPAAGKYSNDWGSHFRPHKGGGWPASSAFPGGRERRPPFTGAPRKLRAVGRQQRRLGGQVEGAYGRLHVGLSGLAWTPASEVGWNGRSWGVAVGVLLFWGKIWGGWTHVFLQQVLGAAQ